MTSKKNKKSKIKLSFFTSILLVIIILLASILVIEIIAPPKFRGNNNYAKQTFLPKLITSKSLQQAQALPLISTTEVPKNISPTPSKKNQEMSYTPPQISGNQLRLPIIMYHYVGNNPNPEDKRRDALSITPDRFEEQMKYLSENGYNTISLDTFYAALKKITPLPPKPVILTFDDGYTDFYYNAYPILKRFNLHATEFIPTGLIGQKAYLTWDQISEMQASGLISFQAHSVHHYTLTYLPKDAALHELTESKKVLESKIGIPVNFMAYPYGATNYLVSDLAKQAGYLGSVGTWPGIIQSEGSIYNMPRFRVSGAVDLTTFIKYLFY